MFFPKFERYKVTNNSRPAGQSQSFVRRWPSDLSSVLQADFAYGCSSSDQIKPDQRILLQKPRSNRQPPAQSPPKDPSLDLPSCFAPSHTPALSSEKKMSLQSLALVTSSISRVMTLSMSLHIFLFKNAIFERISFQSVWFSTVFRPFCPLNASWCIHYPLGSLFIPIFFVDKFLPIHWKPLAFFKSFFKIFLENLLWFCNAKRMASSAWTKTGRWSRYQKFQLFFLTFSPGIPLKFHRFHHGLKVLDPSGSNSSCQQLCVIILA